MSVATDTTDDEEGVGHSALARQMTRDWIPAYAGMTDGGGKTPSLYLSPAERGRDSGMREWRRGVCGNGDEGCVGGV